MDNFRIQDINSDSDGPENGKVQDDATQKGLKKDQFKREENAELISEIAELCNRPEIKDPEVLLLLGSVGVGKSAMVNTIIKAITGKHFPKAKAGRGFENCGIEKYDLKGLQKEAFSNCLNKLPNIIDVPGMGDDNSANIRELLEAVLEGFIPPGTSVESLRKLQDDYGLGCLKKIYPKRRKEWAVTRVVFVTSADQWLPTSLVEIVRSLLESYYQSTGYFKYNIDLFVVITKCDLVEGYSTSETTSTCNMIIQDTFKRTENEVAKEFSIGGAMEQSSLRWQSYVDGRCLDDPYIDNIALKFVKKMMQPRRKRYQVETDKIPVLTPQKRFLLKLKWALNLMDGKQKCCLFFCIYFVVLFVTILVSAKPVKTDGFKH